MENDQQLLDMLSAISSSLKPQSNGGMPGQVGQKGRTELVKPQQQNVYGRKVKAVKQLPIDLTGKGRSEYEDVDTSVAQAQQTTAEQTQFRQPSQPGEVRPTPGGLDGAPGLQGRARQPGLIEREMGKIVE